jgi:Fe2+ or Zn2+ uptake regulation protein/O6-methylguanine-DNA--protein-cysteine methyltransferase
MRSTPQRRAILAVFRGGPAEHLSAEDVYALVARSLPGISRGTVYATLAEFAEAGLLASVGTAEPVRYETNTDAHAHFRCRLCLRLFDVEITLGNGNTDGAGLAGYRIERVEIRAEGICRECRDFDNGLRSGTRSIARGHHMRDALGQPGAAATATDSPIGEIFLAATASGIIRVGFAPSLELESLRALAAAPGGDPRAVRHLDDAIAQLAGYFDGRLSTPVVAIDWSALDAGAVAALQSTLDVPFGTHRSYSELRLDSPPAQIGRIFGSNPLPLFIPCHRVSRGLDIPAAYVAGGERRQWLEDHERRLTADR